MVCYYWSFIFIDFLICTIIYNFLTNILTLFIKKDIPFVWGIFFAFFHLLLNVFFIQIDGGLYGLRSVAVPTDFINSPLTDVVGFFIISELTTFQNVWLGVIIGCMQYFTIGYFLKVLYINRKHSKKENSKS